VRETRGLAARAIAAGVSLASLEAQPERNRDVVFCQLRHPKSAAKKAGSQSAIKHRGSEVDSLEQPESGIDPH
jgi:hypothetical protein